MPSQQYILDQFRRRELSQQVDLLWQALDYMQQDARRSKTDCLALAMGIPPFPKVAAVDRIEGRTLYLTFEHGEQRSVDFRTFFQADRPLEKQLLEDDDAFSSVTVTDGTLTWPEVGRTSKDIEGRDVFYAYDIDPDLLYEAGKPV